MFGGLAGYIVAVENGRAAPSAAATTAAPPAAPTPVVDESELRAYAGNPRARSEKCRRPQIKPGNLLYDGQRYVEAIGFISRPLR